MTTKLLSSTTLRAMVIVYVMIASAFVLMVNNPVASAAATQRTTLTIGLTNDMVSMNPWDPTTNSVWKAYQLEWNYESLFSEDPAFASFPYLANPSAGGAACPTGSVGGQGYCIDSSGLNVTVFLRSNVKFQDGVAMTPLDVVFSFQATAPWGTEETGIGSSIFWDAPRVPLWNSTVYGGACAATNPLCRSHIGVEVGTTANTVVFHLAQPYALFFYDTMFDLIMPMHIWKNHLQSGAPLNLSNPSANIVDTWDRSVDFGYGSSSTQLDAVLGSGPFRITYWKHNSNATIVANPNYWGASDPTASHVWAGTTYPFFPKNLRTIEFVVYGSLDVVSLAIQKGEIDTFLSTSTTPGFLTQIQSNPAIGVTTATDTGYFYLSFNMRKSPWNDLCLRTAISMAINKAYIVNTLLGGFGIQGTVPIGMTNTLYANTSASPPAFNLAGIDPLLNSCGYVKNPSTGFYTKADGTPIVASILAPPKDYDPVRADAAVMISNNLKSVGLDIDAAPTSFDTIVTKAFAQPVDFDMYILGWSLGDFPEAYLCGFFCHSQDVNLNPAGSNSAGYNNPTVDTLLAKANKVIDTTARVSIIKYVEGIVTHDIPWNVLYYKKTISAFRTDTWQGWIPVSGGGSGNNGIYNFWSLMTLAPAGTAQSHGSAGSLQVALTIPDQVLARESVPIDVYVAQSGAPASGASVSVNISYGSVSSTTTYTTDASGHAHLSWTVPVIQGNVIVSVAASKGGLTGTNVKVMEVSIGPPMPIAHLTLGSKTPVIHPGETATITASVTDGTGSGIAGATVKIDTTLVAGTITWATGGNVTAANGTATFAYNAPATAASFPNAHLLDIIKASTVVPNTIVGNIQNAEMTMMIQNDAPPAWYVVSASSAGGVGTSGLVLSPTVPGTTDKAVVTVTVTDFTGTAVAGAPVDAIATETNGTRVFNVTVQHQTGANITDAAGHATFYVNESASAIAATNNTNVFVRFAVHGAASTTSDQLQFLVSKGVGSLGYAAQITFDKRTMPFRTTFAEANSTVHVWDQTGVAKSGVPVFFQIKEGPLGLAAQYPFVYDYTNTTGYSPVNGTGQGLDMKEAGGGSLGGVFQNSTSIHGPSGTGRQGAAFGVENWFNDVEIENDIPNLMTNTAIDSCDPTTWPAGFEGKYFINATSVTDATGVYKTNFFALPQRADSDIQVLAYIGTPGKTLQVISDLWAGGSCTYTFRYANATIIDSGVAAQRAPMFGLGWVKTSAPLFTSQAPALKLIMKFYGVDGSSPGKVWVFLGQGVGRALKLVIPGGAKTCLAATLTTYPGQCALQTNKAGYLNYTYTVPVLSLSQSFTFTAIDADAHWAAGGREQLYSGCTAPCLNAGNPLFGGGGQEFGDYWSAPTFTSLITKISFEFVMPYMYLPTTTAFLTVSSNSGLLPAGGTGTATVQVLSVLTGKPIAGASVWNGNATVLTDATGSASFNYTAPLLGATENLVVATTPYGGVARGWYSFIASLPVLTYSALTVGQQPAGAATSIGDTLTNTLPVGGTMTVYLYVNGNPVAAKQVTVGSSGTATVTFSYVFASAGSYNVTVGTPAGTAAPQTLNIAPTPLVDPVIAYGLSGGLLVVGIVVGAVVGMMLGRRRKPPAVPEAAEEKPAEPGKTAEEELGPEDKL